MSNITKAAVTAFSLAAVLSLAEPAPAVTVTCTASDNPDGPSPQLPGCVPVPGSSNAWVIPAQAPGIDEASDANGEQIMALHFGPGSTYESNETRFVIAEHDGGISDLITVSADTGEVVVTFIGDPPAPMAADAIQIGVETFAEGFVGFLPHNVSQPGAPFLRIVVASDGEFVFDPFGFGADTSDGIRVMELISSVPEPCTLALLGVSIMGLSLARRPLQSWLIGKRLSDGHRRGGRTEFGARVGRD
jgi:hypothetical protein